jgi:hypothetical protein
MFGELAQDRYATVMKGEENIDRISPHGLVFDVKLAK